MSKFNFSGATFIGNNIVIENPFEWEFSTVFVGKKTTERHFKCKKTGAWKCKEFKYGGGLKSITYSLPDSEDYNIKTEEELFKQLQQ
jgi:hypothetical protein